MAATRGNNRKDEIIHYQKTRDGYFHGTAAVIRPDPEHEHRFVTEVLTSNTRRKMMKMTGLKVKVFQARL